MKKLSIFLFFALFTPLFFLSSDECCQESKECCCPEPRACCCPEQGEIDCKKDLLYWTTYEQGLEYTTRSSDILLSDNFTNRPLISPDFHWEYGFRLQAGYTPPCSSWSFLLGWTYLASKATGRHEVDSSAPDYLGIYPVWCMAPNTLSGDYVSLAKMKWYLHTNIIDFTSQYSFKFGHLWVVCPSIGLRCAILNQKLHTEYRGGSFASGICDDQMRNRFLGVGPRFGVDTTCCIGWGFKLYGLFAATPMYGYYRLSHRDEYLDAILFNKRSTENRLALSLDGQLGVQWQGTLLKHWPDFIVMLSYEIHEFFNQNRMYRGNNNFFDKNRDLTMHGGTLSVSFCF